MPFRYPLEFRKKVIEFMDNGHTAVEASDTFDIGMTTIFDWRKRYRENNLAPILHPNYPPRKVNPELLTEYVKMHSDKTLKEIAQALNYGVQTVRSWLIKLNITRKKKRHFIKKATRSNNKNF